MNTQLLKAKVTELHNKIHDMHKDLSMLQSECKHLDYEYKYKGSAGNYCRSDDCYWTVFTCNICRKQWTEEGSHSRHLYLPE